MEDVKEQDIDSYRDEAWEISFNPCFNGRCKRTGCYIGFHFLLLVVSILVLMEDVKEHTNRYLTVLYRIMFQSLF